MGLNDECKMVNDEVFWRRLAVGLTLFSGSVFSGWASGPRVSADIHPRLGMRIKKAHGRNDRRRAGSPDICFHFLVKANSAGVRCSDFDQTCISIHMYRTCVNARGEIF